MTETDKVSMENKDEQTSTASIPDSHLSSSTNQPTPSVVVYDDVVNVDKSSEQAKEDNSGSSKIKRKLAKESDSEDSDDDHHRKRKRKVSVFVIVYC